MPIHLIQPDNFTSIERTPWAGEAIGRLFKSHLVKNCPKRIGESWEFSCDPSLPSRNFKGEVICTLIESNPEILVKIINPQAPLSLQVHPENLYPGLAENESGKPEAWYVLESEPGAGVYLGFKENYSKEDIPRLLEQAHHDEFLHFIEVQKGDYFEISPGIPHAMGPGVVIFEPQIVSPQKSGKTYRMWDWNRRYNTQGILDPKNGVPRELHLDHALNCMADDDIEGRKVEQKCRQLPVSHIFARCSLKVFPSSPGFQLLVFEFKKGASILLDFSDSLAVYTVVEGAISCEKTQVERGHSIFVEHCKTMISCDFEAAKLLAVIPDGLELDSIVSMGV